MGNNHIDNLIASFKSITSKKSKELSSACYTSEGFKISKDGRRLLRCDGKKLYYQIPDGIEIICDNAFSSLKNIIEVKIPESVKYIGSRAFAYSTNITTIKLPNSIEYIGEEAFECTALRSIALSRTNVKHILFRTFDNCGSLNKIVLPRCLKSIADYAFSGTKIKSLDIPDSVEYLGNHILNYDHDKIILPQSLREFSGCSFNAEKMVFQKNMSYLIIDKGLVFSKDRQVLYFASKPNKNVVIPNTVKKIKSECFWGNKKKIQIEFEENSHLEEIEDSGFSSYDYSCSSISFKDSKFPTSVKTIGDDAFYNATFNNVVKLPEGLEKIGSNAFQGCKNLIEINIPKSIKEIGQYVFDGVSTLKYIDVCNENENVCRKALIEYAPKIRVAKLDEIDTLDEIKAEKKKKAKQERQKEKEEFDNLFDNSTTSKEVSIQIRKCKSNDRRIKAKKLDEFLTYVLVKNNWNLVLHKFSDKTFVDGLYYFMADIVDPSDAWDLKYVEELGDYEDLFYIFLSFNNEHVNNDIPTGDEDVLFIMRKLDKYVESFKKTLSLYGTSVKNKMLISYLKMK